MAHFFYGLHILNQQIRFNTLPCPTPHYPAEQQEQEEEACGQFILHIVLRG